MKGKFFRLKGSYLSYVLIYFSAYFAMSAFSSVMSVYLTGIGKSATEMAFIVSSGGIFSLAMVPITGYLCDRLRKPRLINGVLILGMGVSALIFSQCSRVAALFLFNGMTMSFLNSTMPVSERLAAACKYRYGVLRVWGTIGYAVGAQAAGVAIQSFPPIVLFILVAVSTLFAALGYSQAEDPMIPSDGETEKAAGKRIPLSSFLKDPQFLLFLILVFLCAGCSGVNMTYSPMLLDSLGLPTGAVGTVLFFSTLAEIPIIVFSNKFMDLFSGKTLLITTFLIFLVQYLFYGLSYNAAVVVIVMVLLKAIASTMMMMIILKVVGNLVAPELVTTGLSVVNTITNLSGIAMQNLSGVITDHTNIHILYLCMCGLVILGMILSLFLRVGNDRKVFS